MEGDPKFEASQSIPDVPYHLFAISIGLKGDPDEASVIVQTAKQVLGAVLPRGKK